jgi:uncharacterized protein with NAD-binding domain and iron-sulfur cluster
LFVIEIFKARKLSHTYTNKGVIMSEAAPKKKKIAVLGGGMGSLTTVWELTNQPGWDALYDITVYQLGWRLGGKGASGRNMKPIQGAIKLPKEVTETVATETIAPNYRIEEHGLHIFFGFYENAFRILKQAYDELHKLGDDGPFKSVADAFKPHSYVVLQEYYKNRWVPWEMNFPTNDLRPWEGGGTGSLWKHIETTIKFISSNWNEFEKLASESGLFEKDQQVRESLSSAQELSSKIAPDKDKDIDKIRKEVLELLGSLEEFSSLVEPIYQNEKLLQDDLQRRRLIMLDFAASNVKGLLADGVIINGFDSLNKYDYAEWLRRHGAKEMTIQAPVVRMLYDLVYGFEQGDIKRPRLAAGVGLRALVKMLFEYDGAIMWKMQAGMGDVVFTPIYKVLKRRGVKFNFFHSVTHIGLSEDKKSIDNIKINLQATIKDNKEYKPLIEVKNLSCWPSEALYDQLEQGEELKSLTNKDPHNNPLESFWSTWKPVNEIALKAEEDFDVVILGISIAALPYICGELIDVSPKWKNMVNNIQTVTTQGGQIWLKKTLPQLGWDRPIPVVGSYVEPLDTYADMSHLIEKENWQSNDYPQNLAYFTGVIRDLGTPPPGDSQFPSREQKRIDQEAISSLKNDIGYLWPKATTEENPQGLDWNLLVDPNNSEGENRFNSQYWRVNINPTERYVMSVPGSIKYRLKTDESGFDRLYLTGDWINNSFNAGAIEPTCMSGMQTARAVLKREFRIRYTQKIVHEDDISLQAVATEVEN